MEGNQAITVAVNPGSIPREYDGRFDCNLCVDLAENGVVTFCGHLFCWGCLLQHLKHSFYCPVCQGQVSAKKVIPIYGGRVDAAVSGDGIRARPRPPLVTVKKPPPPTQEGILRNSDLISAGDRFGNRSNIIESFEERIAERMVNRLERLSRMLAELEEMRILETGVDDYSSIISMEEERKRKRKMKMKMKRGRGRREEEEEEDEDEESIEEEEDEDEERKGIKGKGKKRERGRGRRRR